MDHLTLGLQNFLQQKTFKIAQMHGDHTAHMTPENRVGHADTSADAHHPHIFFITFFGPKMVIFGRFMAPCFPDAICALLSTQNGVSCVSTVHT